MPKAERNAVSPSGCCANKLMKWPTAAMPASKLLIRRRRFAILIGLSCFTPHVTNRWIRYLSSCRRLHDESNHNYIRRSDAAKDFTLFWPVDLDLWIWIWIVTVPYLQSLVSRQAPELGHHANGTVLSYRILVTGYQQFVSIFTDSNSFYPASIKFLTNQSQCFY